MTILPLIERELRVRARGRGFYWARLAVVLTGSLICLPIILLDASPWFGGQSAAGHYAFSNLVITAFFLICCAGLMTADNISRQQREGTLGLLLLTRVRTIDVLLGAFGSAGITCVCALAALLPVLILPLLTGGVTGSEAGRKVIVLFDTLFLSLTAGLWASARGQGWFKSSCAALLLLFALICVPPLIGWPGPITALGSAEDASYRADPGRYWISIVVVQGTSWLLLILGGIRLRGAMRTQATPRTLENPAYQTKPFKPIRDGVDPLAWLMRRQRHVMAVIWTATVLRIIYNLAFRVFTLSRGFRMWPSQFLYIQGAGVAVSLLEGCLFAWAATRFFIEARRSGELEIVLTTPEAAKNIVSSQWRWLRQVLFWPMAALLLPYLAILYLTWSVLPQWGLGLFGYLFNYINTIYCLFALFWVGLWFGFKAPSQAGAVLRTVLLVKGVPYLLYLLENLLQRFLIRGFPSGWQFGYWTFWAMLQFITLLYFRWLILWARRRFRNERAGFGARPLTPKRGFFHGFAGVASFFAKFRRWPAPPAQ